MRGAYCRCGAVSSTAVGAQTDHDALYQMSHRITNSIAAATCQSLVECDSWWRVSLALPARTAPVSSPVPRARRSALAPVSLPAATTITVAVSARAALSEGGLQHCGLRHRAVMSMSCTRPYAGERGTLGAPGPVHAAVLARKQAALCHGAGWPPNILPPARGWCFPLHALLSNRRRITGKRPPLHLLLPYSTVLG
jgi:hypothetical protein